MSSEAKVLASLRGMAWQRAKGELASMLDTYGGDGRDYESRKYEAMREAVEEFVTRVEDHGLQE